MLMKSRGSWGALFADVFVALAVYILLIVLAAALGLSFADRFQTNSAGASLTPFGFVLFRQPTVKTAGRRMPSSMS
jgi:hypothetical protein